MYEQCLMLRPHMQTSSLRAGQDGGTPCMTSFRVPQIQTDVRCPSHCPCPNCTSTPEKAMKQRTARACPQPRGRPGRGTANLTHTVTASTRIFNTVKPFTMCGSGAGG
ncbi:hypothetical protein NQD34_012886 [Periophthalmus magnuspinnatus]|nr:hypothetical protein NQD34_012886 [Periophthalmus magnuspinnatus]